MTRLLGITCLTVVVTGCEKALSIRSLPDAELARRYGACLDNTPTAPGKATACENMRKECERRKEDLERYICRIY